MIENESNSIVRTINDVVSILVGITVLMGALGISVATYFHNFDIAKYWSYTVSIYALYLTYILIRIVLTRLGIMITMVGNLLFWSISLWGSKFSVIRRFMCIDHKYFESVKEITNRKVHCILLMSCEFNGGEIHTLIYQFSDGKMEAVHGDNAIVCGLKKIDKLICVRDQYIIAEPGWLFFNPNLSWKERSQISFDQDGAMNAVHLLNEKNKRFKKSYLPKIDSSLPATTTPSQ